MPASRFAAWAGASAKTWVTGVTKVAGGSRASISAAFEAAAEVTRLTVPPVTEVTTLTRSVTKVTQVTWHPDVGLPENSHADQCGNPGNPSNPEAEQRVDAVEGAADPAWWRDQYAERAATRQYDGGRPRAEAELLAWGELENRWNLAYGERVARDFCAGCRRAVGAEAALDLMDGNRVHDRAEHDCLIRHGKRWRGAATRALIAMGLEAPCGSMSPEVPSVDFSWSSEPVGAVMSGPCVPKTTADAVRQQAYAARNRAVANEQAGDPIGARWALLEAVDMEAYAADFLELPADSGEVGAGSEMVPIGNDAAERPDFVETVRSAPDMVTARASLARLNLAAETGTFDLALDVADTIKARNSLEKMLAHQLAAAHGLAMKFAAKSEQMLGFVTSWDAHARQQVSSIEASRLGHSAVRMMEAYNAGLLTLDRLRHGRQQVVTVQHVTVGPGGRAIVAGKVKAAGPGRGGRGRK